MDRVEVSIEARERTGTRCRSWRGSFSKYTKTEALSDGSSRAQSGN